MRNEKRNKKSFLVIPHSTLRIPHWRDMHFRDRAEAGRLLAQALKKYQKQDGVVYALPRGGGGRRGARRRRELYLGGREPSPVEGKTAIIVDDGIATGLTMEVSIRDALRRRPAHLVVAVPVAPPRTVERLSRAGDEVVGVEPSPYSLCPVGACY